MESIGEDHVQVAARRRTSSMHSMKGETPQTAEVASGVITPGVVWQVFVRFISGQPLFEEPILRHASQTKEVWSHLSGEVKAHSVDKDPWVLKILNPYNLELWVLPVRGVLLLGILLLLFYINHGFFSEKTLGVIGGAVAAPLVMRFLLFFSERVLNIRDIRCKALGQYPMVVWLCFTFYMEMIYTVVKNAVNRVGDARESTEIREAAQVYDERSGAQLDEDGRYYFDFVADTGDGFNATFAVASLMGRKRLNVFETSANGTTKETVLPRASAVLHGGDICYPLSNFTNLFYRFIQPYSWAFPKAAGSGEKMFLAAGNHEYMDGLAGYRDILLPIEHIGGWQTPQKGSYFAIRLPHDWILFVVDIGPEPEEIDEHQLAFFNSIELGASEKVIMLYHLPDWIKCGSLGFSNMKRVQAWRKQLGSRLRLVLTGDLHYYKRMEIDEAGDVEEVEEPESNDEFTNCFKTSKRTYLVAGHGGAFAHATHFPLLSRIPLVEDLDSAAGEEKFLVTKKDYPSIRDSEMLWTNSAPKMFITTGTHIYSRVIAGLYMVAFLNVSPLIYVSGVVDFYNLFITAVTGPFLYIVFAWFLVSHAIMVLANQPVTISTFPSALVLIVAHTLAHIAVAFVFRYGVDLFLFASFATDVRSMGEIVFAYCLCANICVYLLGTLFGPLVSTLYFQLAVYLFDWHYNETFGIICVDAYRGFCRFAINPNGDIDLYSIVCDASPRDWVLSQPSKENPAKLESPSLDYYLLEKVTITKEEG